MSKICTYRAAEISIKTSSGVIPLVPREAIVSHYSIPDEEPENRGHGGKTRGVASRRMADSVAPKKAGAEPELLLLSPSIVTQSSRVYDFRQTRTLLRDKGVTEKDGNAVT